MATILELTIGAADLHVLFPDREATPWMTTERCRVMFERRGSTLFLIDEYRGPGEARSWLEERFDWNFYGQRVMTIEVPATAGGETRRNAEVNRDRIELHANTSGGRSLVLDVFREFRDTGGYIIRRTATVHLDKEGKLLAFKAEKFEAEHRYPFGLGPFGDFESEAEISCGELNPKIAD